MYSRSRLASAAVATLLLGAYAYAGEPYPPDTMTSHYQTAAQYIVDQTGVDRGYCFVFGAGRGRLAYELALRGNLRFIAAETSVAEVDAGRTALVDTGYYGARIVLQEASSLSALRYRDYAGVLVVSDSIIEDGACTGSAAEMYRMARPAGGVVLVGQPAGVPNVLTEAELTTWLDAGGLSGLYTVTNDADGVWARIDRAPLAGAGEWTHMWADIGNTACSRDTRITDSWRVLWFGGPGPRALVDRHLMPAAPLVKNGRMIVPGDNRLICVDAYNGYRYWEALIPDSSRIALVRDAGWACLDSEFVYAASGTGCAKIELDTGTVVDTFTTPSSMDWGYVAVDGDDLLGSEQIVDASQIGPRNTPLLAYESFKPVVTSRKLFCLNRNTGAEKWAYDNSTAIPNPTICADSDAVYFIESSDAVSLADTDGSVGIDQVCTAGQASLVKVMRSDGSVAWRKQYDWPFEHVIYLSVSNGVVLASGCYDGSQNFMYDFFAYDTANGNEIWNEASDSGIAVDPTVDHGEQNKHAMIVGTTIHHKHGGYDLLTGASAGFPFTTSNCADYSASDTHFFSRRSNRASIYSMSGGGDSTVIDADVRPGCYISIIPAGGMILLPAYSTGCTCDFSMETTFGWQPQ